MLLVSCFALPLQLIHADFHVELRTDDTDDEANQPAMRIKESSKYPRLAGSYESTNQRGMYKAVRR